jgi:hypothetical protein
MAARRLDRGKPRDPEFGPCLISPPVFGIDVIIFASTILSFCAITFKVVILNPVVPEEILARLNTPLPTPEAEAHFVPALENKTPIPTED